MAKYLDGTGLSVLWTKILSKFYQKSEVYSKTETYSKNELYNKLEIDDLLDNLPTGGGSSNYEIIVTDEELFPTTGSAGVSENKTYSFPQPMHNPYLIGAQIYDYNARGMNYSTFPFIPSAIVSDNKIYFSSVKILDNTSYLITKNMLSGPGFELYFRLVIIDFLS